MDRIVWLIALSAMSSLLLDIGRIAADARGAKLYLKTSVRENSAIPEKEVEVITYSPDTEDVSSTETSQKMFFPNPNGSRNELLDNIFNIPIATLKAVNDLVQSIAGGLQTTGRSIFSGKLQTTHTVVKEKAVLH